MTTPVPSYEDLSALGELGERHSWGVLRQESAALSFVQPEAIVHAARNAGRTVRLNLPINALLDPPTFGRKQLTPEVVKASHLNAEDVIGSFNPQSSKRFDGLFTYESSRAQVLRWHHRCR